MISILFFYECLYSQTTYDREYTLKKAGKHVFYDDTGEFKKKTKSPSLCVYSVEPLGSPRSAPLFSDTNYTLQTTYAYQGKASTALPEHPWVLSKNNADYLSETSRAHFQHHDPELFLSKEATAKNPSKSEIFHRKLNSAQFIGVTSHGRAYPSHDPHATDNRSFAPAQRAGSKYPFNDYECPQPPRSLQGSRQSPLMTQSQNTSSPRENNVGTQHFQQTTEYGHHYTSDEFVRKKQMPMKQLPPTSFVPGMRFRPY